MLNQLDLQRQYFNTGITKSYTFRKTQLEKLKKAVLAQEEALYEAMYVDLKKSKEEVWVTEIGMVKNELNYAIANLRNWMEPERVGTNLANLPGSSKLLHEPLGVVLIIAPWNYPFQLLFNPLVGAIAAGNCVVLKPSEFAKATDTVMQKIINSTFAPEYISYYNGDGATIIKQLMEQIRFDHIFYTGSTAVGKIIYKMAAEQLIPVTLELGGKSPCIVEQDANITVAAKRIAVTKFSNCGQMCVAPDYVLVHESKRDALIAAFKKIIPQFFTTDASRSYNYGKIINEKQFNRLVNYLPQGTIAYGGHYNKETLYIEPTLLVDVAMQTTIMQDEIFGPILPIISFKEKEEAVAMIQQNPNPLAFYVFTGSRKNEKFWVGNIAFGGGCVNNASWHLTNHHLPFGGRGFSGTGAYHGKFSFDVFSHKKAIMKTPTWFDPSIKYPPFKGKLGIFKKLIG
jgi:aldehyde dehydrogenase (NAD+)